MQPLVTLDKVFLPPLHIKLGLTKNVVKGMNKNFLCFQYLKTNFSRISDATLKKGIIGGSQLRKLMTDITFNSKLNRAEKITWAALIEVCHNFLGNTIADNYRKIIQELLSAHRM